MVHKNKRAPRTAKALAKKGIRWVHLEVDAPKVDNIYAVAASIPALKAYSERQLHTALLENIGDDSECLQLLHRIFHIKSAE